MLRRETDQEKQAQKGFTLVELVIVMAVLVVLAAIAIPRYNGVLNESKVKSDAITAAGIVNAARIQETGGDSVNALTDISEDYFEPGKTPTSGGEFLLERGTNGAFEITWTPDEAGVYNGIAQRVTEGAVFTLAKETTP